MENEQKSEFLNEQLRKFKYRVDYIVNESPRYRPLVNDGEEFDNLPMNNEAGDQEDAVKPDGGEKPAEPSNNVPVGAEPPVPEFDKGTPPPPPDAGEMPSADPSMGGMPPVPEAPKVDDIQNEIIKHNIEAMKSIHDQLEQLNSIVQSLNNKQQELNADVEEVREPTNTEKLMNKTKVSYPYYFNLNDFWSGNWFNQQRDKEMSKGIKELPDGTFVADFDDLPQKSKIDVQNSFSDVNESIKKKFLKEDINAQQSLIDGRSKLSAINLIYKRITPLSQGFFRDESWENVRKIFNVFNEMGLDWDIMDAKYNGSMPPESKHWRFEINFTANDGRPKKIYGGLTASGAGTVEDPLEKYDISVVLS